MDFFVALCYARAKKVTRGLLKCAITNYFDRS